MTKILNKRQFGDHTRSFYSHKNKKLMWLDGSFEKKVALCYEFDSNIVAYCSQPSRYPYQDASGKNRIYTPDFLVKTNSETEPYYLDEAKMSKYLQSNNFEVLLPFIRHSLKNNFSLNLKIVTEHDIAAEQKLKNFIHLYYFKRIPVSACIATIEIRKAIGNVFTLQELKVFIDSTNKNRSNIGCLLTHNILSFDWDKKINNDLILEIAS